MFEDLEVAVRHVLRAGLSFAGVVQDAFFPPVEVAVLVPGLRVGEDHDVR